MFATRDVVPTLINAGKKTTYAPEPDLIDRLTEAVAHSHWRSFRSLVIGVAALIFATVLRALFGSLGDHFPLTLYFPAILAAGVLAGIPTAIGVAAGSVAIVWWAFIPPAMQFTVPQGDDFAVLLLFAVACSVTIIVAALCRGGLLRLHQHQLAYRTIADELQHRNRNAMAVVAAIIKKTLQHDAEGAEVILGRLRAVDYANELLTDPAQQSVPLATILASEFSPYGNHRLTADGPELTVAPGAARYIILIIHELATNSAKYGALSVPTGRVAIDWQIEGRSVVLKWRELGGPALRGQSDRSGFGSALIHQSVRALSGTFEPVLGAKGFSCVLTFVIGENKKAIRWGNSSP